jgi:hypothetical protein
VGLSAAGAPPAAVILDALAAPVDPELDRAIGPGAAQRLRAELRARARRWVAALAPGLAYEATSPASALLALAGHRGPVVLVAPDVPALGPAHRAAVVGDLDAGMGLIVGSAHDAQPYLVALRDPDPELLELAGDGFEALIAAGAERGLAFSMIRHERRLAGPGDARALALDPLAPEPLVAQLGFLRPRG